VHLRRGVSGCKSLMRYVAGIHAGRHCLAARRVACVVPCAGAASQGGELWAASSAACLLRGVHVKCAGAVISKSIARAASKEHTAPCMSRLVGLPMINRRRATPRRSTRSVHVTPARQSISSPPRCGVAAAVSHRRPRRLRCFSGVTRLSLVLYYADCNPDEESSEQQCVKLSGSIQRCNLLRCRQWRRQATARGRRRARSSCACS
jgi:hypothetical protein